MDIAGHSYGAFGAMRINVLRSAYELMLTTRQRRAVQVI